MESDSNTKNEWLLTVQRCSRHRLLAETMSSSNLKVTIHMHNKFVKKASAEERKKLDKCIVLVIICVLDAPIAVVSMG